MIEAELRLRVTVTDAWDTVTVTVPPDTSIAALKSEALSRALGPYADPSAYVVKSRGALVLDERMAVAGLDLVDGAPLVVVPSRRRPVR
ncbi:MAG TPA: hypothetical protein VGA37_04780 [Gemmatimonadales bacterium]